MILDPGPLVFIYKENDGFRAVPVHPGLVLMKSGSLFVESSMFCESWVCLTLKEEIFLCFIDWQKAFYCVY